MPELSPLSPSVRLDIWLWAARFFKTRSLAKQAIETGKVSVAGQRPNPHARCAWASSFRSTVVKSISRSRCSA